MGDFDLTLPGRRHQYTLGNYQLRLDPQIATAIRALQTRPASPLLRNLFLSPNWAALQQSLFDASLRQPPPTASPPLVPRGAGPASARTAQVGDLLSAVWAVPMVQQNAMRLLNDASVQLRRDWNRLSTGEQALIISYGTVLVGSSLTAVLSNQEGRTFVMGLIAGQDIPIPGVSGLTVRINERGAGATYRNIGSSGVTVGGAGGVNQHGQAEYNVQVTLDVNQFIRAVAE